MKISEVKPSVRKFEYRQEKGDADYGSCLWADFILDCDAYTLSIQSDCGNYAYSWTPTPNSESFIHLMCRINSGYLLNKIATENVFDINESIRGTIENLDLTEETDAELISEIEAIDRGYGEESYCRECDDIMRRHNIRDGWESIHIEKNYPAGAQKIVQIFCGVVVPYLRTLPEAKHEPSE